MPEFTATPNSSTSMNSTMTYARSRLWLGITSVGFFVVLAVTLLLLGGGPAVIKALGLEQAPSALVLAAFLGCYLLASIPGDLVGGFLLPRRFERTQISFAEFFATWLRGVLAQVVVMFATGLILLQAGQSFGIFGYVAAAGLLMLVFVQLQWPLARLAAHFRPHPAPPSELSGAIAKTNVCVIESHDSGFVGGYVGLPGLETLVLPAAWTRVLSPAELEIQIRRRAALLTTGTRTRGLIVGLAWNLLGLTTAAYLPGSDVATVGGLMTLSLWFTIWSFLGLLILPTVSRRGVYEADRQVLLDGVSRDNLEAVMRKLDQLQEDEPDRPSGVEAIFHPVPSVQNRLRAALQPGGGRGAYHAVRLALPTSWCCLGFLARAVHCNCGRPAVWVMLPGD